MTYGDLLFIISKGTLAFFQIPDIKWEYCWGVEIVEPLGDPNYIYMRTF